MKAGVRKFGLADRQLLPEGRLAGPMPWVIAIMMFLTVLAAASGLALGSAARGLGQSIGERVSVQIIEANPDLRGAQAAATAARLRAMDGVVAVRQLSEEEVSALLEPWLGSGGLDADVPMPALIDVDLTPAAYAEIDQLRAAVIEVAPAARVDDSASWLAPLATLIRALRLLALALVLLMIGATAATVVLAARAALDTHRGTIEVLHLMGATDVQVARLFQRRIALDALFGGVVGLLAGLAVLLLIRDRVAQLGSELLGAATLPPAAWLALAALPIGGVLLAMVVARTTILRALSKLL